MSGLHFNVSLDSPGIQADAVLGNTVFEVKGDVRDLRHLRDSFMQLARIAAGDGDRRVIFVLLEPQINEGRLRAEWQALRSIFRPGIFNRLVMVIHREGAPLQPTSPLSAQESASMPAIVEQAHRRQHRAIRRPSEAFFDVLRVLIVHWFRQTGPLTSKQLAQETGFSYPTIAEALTRLDTHLTRHSDRRVELRSFPHDDWFALVSQAGKVRSSQAYADRSGRPRPPKLLLDRLRRLHRDDIAVGGALGARHYVPGLDLIGTPRLDLVMTPSGPEESRRIRELVHHLDPALKAAEPGEPSQLVVHTLYRPVPFFQKDAGGTCWADEVECLLDLHEARLEPQALEFLDRLTPAKNT